MPDINQDQIQGGIIPEGLKSKIGQSKQEIDPEFDEIYSKIEDEYRKFNSNLIMLKNKAEEQRIKSLRNVLQTLMLNGIDPNDPEQINAFLQRLEEVDPDLLILFNDSMNGLLGDEETTVPEDATEREGLNPEMPQEQNSPSQQFPNLMQQ